MLEENKILVGISQKGQKLFLNPPMANRHGLIAGATGTGKTITLQVLAESFSDLGVPVFLADVKGDLSGMCQPGKPSPKVLERLEKMGISNFDFCPHNVRFWDVFGSGGVPVRTTVSEMGPMLIARLLELTAVQEGVLNLVFKIADDSGKFLIDWKDLRAMLVYVGNHNQEYTLQYGNISKQSVGAIQRALLAVEQEGAEKFFGEPNLQISDWIETDRDGKGIVNVLHCVELYQKPSMYAAFLLWPSRNFSKRFRKSETSKNPK